MEPAGQPSIQPTSQRQPTHLQVSQPAKQASHQQPRYLTIDGLKVASGQDLDPAYAHFSYCFSSSKPGNPNNTSCTRPYKKRRLRANSSLSSKHLGICKPNKPSEWATSQRNKGAKHNQQTTHAASSALHSKRQFVKCNKTQKQQQNVEVIYGPQSYMSGVIRAFGHCASSDKCPHTGNELHQKTILLFAWAT